MFLAAAVTVAASVPASAKKKNSNAVGDVIFELVGQSSLPSSPPVLTQSVYGYLTYVNGISGTEAVFNPGPQNESTTLSTFYNDTVAERVINNGPIRVINRVGTSAIYLDSTPDGDFNNPNTFRDGLPVQTSQIRLQFVLDTVTGAFTVTLVQTITSSDFFVLGNYHFLLGKVGLTYRTTYVGHVTASGSPAAHLAGFAVGDIKRYRAGGGSNNRLASVA